MALSGRLRFWRDIVFPLGGVGLIVGAVALVMWQEEAASEPDQQMQVGSFLVHYAEGDADEARALAEDASRFIDALHRVYGDLIGALSLPAERCELTFYGPAVVLSQGGLTAGYYRRGSCHVVVRLEHAGDSPSLVLRHELAHLALNRGGGKHWAPLPYWLSEGLAQWFEGASLVRVGSEVPAPRLTENQRGLSLAALLGARRQGHLGPRDLVFYQRAHWLVDRLIALKGRQFWSFVRLARNRRVSRHEFETLFGALEPLDRALSNANAPEP